MTRPDTRLPALAGRITLCALAIASALASSSAAAPPAIPSEPPNGPSLVPNFEGQEAQPNPVDAPKIPRHPYMARNGYSQVHDDGYASDTYTWGGPLGRQPTVNSQFSGGIGICGITIALDRLGRPLTNCISPPDRQQLTLMDPVTLEKLATYDLPPRIIPPGVNPFVAGGGAYFYVDNKDRVVVSVGRHIQMIALRGRASSPHFELVRDFDLTSVIAADDQLNSALPDWKGNIWFVTREHGVVGVVDRKTGEVLSRRELGSPIENSFAVDEDGAVYIVSDAAMYRFKASAKGRIQTNWKHAYANSGVQKPGQFTAGSGTTPTLMGRKYVAITDNADPMDVVVYRRPKNTHGEPRVVCTQPVFQQGAGATENSLIGTGRALVVENNYGYAPPPDATSNGGTTTPGIERVDVIDHGERCRTRWHSDVIAPSVVPKLSLANGLVYTITKPPGSPDPWYLTALDFRTGETVFSRLLGTGTFYNNHYAGISIAPTGDLYIGVLGGTVRVVDGG
jgi:hypothetical protein